MSGADNECWGYIVRGGDAHLCTPGFVNGINHFKNKFCPACHDHGMKVDAVRLRVSLPNTPITGNGTTEGFWNASPCYGGRFRVINQTAKCTPPSFVLLEDPDSGLASMPYLTRVQPHYIDEDGLVNVFASRGTLIPYPPGQAERLRLLKRQRVRASLSDLNPDGSLKPEDERTCESLVGSVEDAVQHADAAPMSVLAKEALSLEPRAVEDANKDAQNDVHSCRDLGLSCGFDSKQPEMLVPNEMPSSGVVAAEKAASLGEKGAASGAMRNVAERKEWTTSDDILIRESVHTHGFKWRVIAALLPGRSDDAVRNRWNRLNEAEQPKPLAVEADASSAELSESSLHVLSGKAAPRRPTPRAPTSRAPTPLAPRTSEITLPHDATMEGTAPARTSSAAEKVFRIDITKHQVHIARSNADYLAFLGKDFYIEVVARYDSPATKVGGTPIMLQAEAVFEDTTPVTSACCGTLNGACTKLHGDTVQRLVEGRARFSKLRFGPHCLSSRHRDANGNPRRFRILVQSFDAQTGTVLHGVVSQPVRVIWGSSGSSAGPTVIDQRVASVHSNQRVDRNRHLSLDEISDAIWEQAAGLTHTQGSRQVLCLDGTDCQWCKGGGGSGGGGGAACTAMITKKNSWTEDEEKSLLRLVPRVGFKWSHIGELLPGHSAVSCRERYTMLSERFEARWRAVELGENKAASAAAAASSTLDGTAPSSSPPGQPPNLKRPLESTPESLALQQWLQIQKRLQVKRSNADFIAAGAAAMMERGQGEGGGG
jgi:hypothetical protein